MSACLKKDPAQRLTISQLLTHPFLQYAPSSNVISEIFFKVQERSTSFSEVTGVANEKDKQLKGTLKESVDLESRRRSANVVFYHEVDTALASHEPLKGSIVSLSNHHLLAKIHQISNKADLDPITRLKNQGASEEDCEKASLVYLKIKRSIIKVEKLRPGLTTSVA